MPKKPNSHGDMQNYVPPGNGDASGEYADGEGSNIHYFDPETFGKGKGEEPKAEEPKEGHIEVSKGEPKGGNFSKYLETFNEDKGVTRDGLKGVYDAGTDEAKGVVDALIADGYGIKPIRGRDNFEGRTIEFSQGTVRDDPKMRNKGEVFYHEFHHAVDDWLAKDATEEEKDAAMQDVLNSRLGKTNAFVEAFRSGQYGSAVLKTSNGKTLYQTIVGEVGKQKIKEVSQAFREEKEKAWRDAVGMTLPEQVMRQREVDKRLQNQALSEGFKEWTEPYWNRIRELREKDPEYNELDEVYRKGNEAERSIIKDWASLSDVVEGAGGMSLCAGHGDSYWKSGTRNGSRWHRGAEFIAEYGSAYSRRNGSGKRELELFRKYFPESSKAAEELCERAIKKSKGAK